MKHVGGYPSFGATPRCAVVNLPDWVSCFELTLAASKGVKCKARPSEDHRQYSLYVEDRSDRATQQFAAFHAASPNPTYRFQPLAELTGFELEFLIILLSVLFRIAFKLL